MDKIEIHTIGDIKGKKPTIVIGFPGTGLVGSVAASQIVDSLGLEFVGYITSPSFAPLAAIHDYKPLPPARIHFSQKHNLVVILSEMSIPVNASMELAEKIYQFSKTINASLIVSLGGISLKEGDDTVYIVSSDRAIIKEIVNKKLAKPIREGATTGVTGILLARGALEKFPVLSILAESSEDYLDPKAAGNAVRMLSKVLEIRIATDALDKDAREIASTMRETVIKSKTPRKSAGEEGTMYG